MPQELRQAIRDVKDFPKDGIVFKDITPILADPALFQRSIDLLSALVASEDRIDKVVGIDARGFIFAAPVAVTLDAGFIPVRKSGKLPWRTHRCSYTLEYGEDAVEIHQDAIKPGERVLLVDDLLATGGTASAAVSLLKELGADLVAVAFLVELSSLRGRDKIDCARIESLITY